MVDKITVGVFGTLGGVILLTASLSLLPYNGRPFCQFSETYNTLPDTTCSRYALDDVSPYLEPMPSPTLKQVNANLDDLAALNARMDDLLGRIPPENRNPALLANVNQFHIYRAAAEKTNLHLRQDMLAKATQIARN